MLQCSLSWEHPKSAAVSMLTVFNKFYIDAIILYAMQRKLGLGNVIIMSQRYLFICLDIKFYSGMGCEVIMWEWGEHIFPHEKDQQ